MGVSSNGETGLILYDTTETTEKDRFLQNGDSDRAFMHIHDSRGLLAGEASLLACDRLKRLLQDLQTRSARSLSAKLSCSKILSITSSGHCGRGGIMCTRGDQRSPRPAMQHCI